MQFHRVTEAFKDLESIGKGAVRGHRSASPSGPIVIIAGDLPLAFNHETAGEAISEGFRVVLTPFEFICVA